MAIVHAPDIAEALAPIELSDTEGGTHRLGGYWAGGPAVFVFLRHFGCMFCRQLTQDMSARAGDFEKRGARVVLVGCGKAHHGAAFKADLNPPFPLLVDPKRTAYRAVEFRHGIGKTLSIPSAVQAMKAMAAGHRQKKTQGDPWQLGGIIGIGAHGAPFFVHRDQHSGDHAKIDDVIAALAGAAGGQPA